MGSAKEHAERPKYTHWFCPTCGEYTKRPPYLLNPSPGHTDNWVCLESETHWVIEFVYHKVDDEGGGDG